MTPADVAVRLGYSSEDASGALEGANMGLGCGNPQAIASLQPVDESRELIREWAEDSNIADFVLSANIEAVKP